MAADGKPIVSRFVISGIMLLIRIVLNLLFISNDVFTINAIIFLIAGFSSFWYLKYKSNPASDWRLVIAALFQVQCN